MHFLPESILSSHPINLGFHCCWASPGCHSQAVNVCPDLLFLPPKKTDTSTIFLPLALTVLSSVNLCCSGKSSSLLYCFCYLATLAISSSHIMIHNDELLLPCLLLERRAWGVGTMGCIAREAKSRGCLDWWKHTGMVPDNHMEVVVPNSGFVNKVHFPFSF